MTSSIFVVAALTAAVVGVLAVSPREGDSEREPWYRITQEGPKAFPRIALSTRHKGHYWTIFQLNSVIDLDVLAEIGREFEAGATGMPAGFSPGPSIRFDFYPDRVEACESLDFDNDGRDWPTVCHPLPVQDFREMFTAYHAAMKAWHRVNNPQGTK